MKFAIYVSTYLAFHVVIVITLLADYVVGKGTANLVANVIGAVVSFVLVLQVIFSEIHRRDRERRALEHEILKKLLFTQCELIMKNQCLGQLIRARPSV